MSLYHRKGIWYARLWKDGQIHRVSLGTRDLMEARSIHEEHFGPVAREVQDVGSFAPEPPKTLGEVVDAWMRRIRLDHRDKPETINSYATQARRYRKRWGRMEPDELTRDHVMQWRDERLREAARSTVKRERAILLAFLRWAERGELIPEVPRLDPIKGVSKKRKSLTVLSPEEIEKLLAVARVHPRPQLRALYAAVMVAANSGLRRNELVWLQWKDIDLRRRILHVRPKKGFSPKSRERREVPINEKLLSDLKDLRRARSDADWVCETAQLRQWPIPDITRRARELFKAADLYEPGQPTLHALRHSFASTLAGRGADVETLRELLGHHSVSVTEIYMHTGMERMRRAVECL